MVRIEPATFWMGSPPDEARRDDDELRHRVKLQQPFEMGRTEVTQAQWTAVMGSNPSRFQSGDEAPTRPVERVSWFEAIAYLNRLSSRAGLTRCYETSGCSGEIGSDYACTSVRYVGPACRGYRLPTEAEWEYAARGRIEKARYGDIETIAWFGGNSTSTTHPVAGKAANAFGLHDMIGNVYEWVNDGYAPYSKVAAEDQSIPDPGAKSWTTPPRLAVVRGCSWFNFAEGCRAAVRGRFAPDYRNYNIGFRPARSVP